jgi:hypothetical protein
MTGLPEPRTAYALLIGVKTFNDELYKPLQACYSSVEKLAELLQAEGSNAMWQLPADRIELLGPVVTAPEARAALKKAVDSPDLKALLVCVSCHGKRYDDDGYSPPGLHLAMTDSDSELPGSHLHFDEISKLLGQAARDRDIPHIVLIVDACWSDDARLEVGMGRAAAAEIDHLAVPGVVTLSATKRRVIAWPYWPGTDWTAFLGAMINSIENGIPGPRAVLTAKDIFTAASGRLAEARKTELSIPEPRFYEDGLSEVPLCRNREYHQPVKVDDSWGTGPDAVFTNADECFKAIQAAHKGNHDPSVAGIVKNFCENTDIAESEIAKLMKKLEESEFSACLVFAYRAVCAERSPDKIARSTHSLHVNKASINSGLLLHALGERAQAPHDIYEVYKLLHRLECPECIETAERVAALVLEMDNRDLSRDVLAQWL